MSAFDEFSAVLADAAPIYCRWPLLLTWVRRLASASMMRLPGTT
jgi:hypothetical protein